MPRYFFDVDDGDLRMVDEDGEEMPGPAEAREQALALLPDVARSVMPDGDRRVIVSAVRDERGQEVYRATLSLVGEWLSEGR